MRPNRRRLAVAALYLPCDAAFEAGGRGIDAGGTDHRVDRRRLDVVRALDAPRSLRRPGVRGRDDLARRPRPSPARADAAGRGRARGRDRARHHGARGDRSGRCASPVPTQWSCRWKSIATAGGSKTSTSRAAHGVEHVLGENAGPGGLAHALRTIPLVAEIARDVERLAPIGAPDQLHESRRPDLHRVPAPPRPADHRPVPRGGARAAALLGPARPDDRVPGRRPQPSHRARRGAATRPPAPTSRPICTRRRRR